MNTSGWRDPASIPNVHGQYVRLRLRGAEGAGEVGDVVVLRDGTYRLHDTPIALVESWLPDRGGIPIHHRADRGVATITVYTGPDGFGRQQFSISWWAENHDGGPQWRGQFFRANVQEHAAKLRAEGRRVVIEKGTDK